MTLRNNIEYLLQELSNIKDNVVIIDKQDMFHISDVENGVLIIYASWSGNAIASVRGITKMLNGYHYNGQIIIADIDCLEPDFQLEKLSVYCHGWGEIFLIKMGAVERKYVSRNCFLLFQRDYKHLNLSI